MDEIMANAIRILYGLNGLCYQQAPLSATIQVLTLTTSAARSSIDRQWAAESDVGAASSQ